MRYIIALDQGTTSSRAVLFDQNGAFVASHSIEFEQLYPKPGWVEHRPDDLYNSQVEALKAAVKKAGVPLSSISAIGITNQRETTLIWHRETLKPLYNAIVWQCRRTAPLVERLKHDGMSSIIREKTGLIPDAYFSGTKLQWLLDEVPDARALAQAGKLCFGTVDSYLAMRLSGERVHVTDATNAARTMLYNIHDQSWDDVLLRAMNIEKSVLPEVVDSSKVIGTLKKDILGVEIPIAALAGDQHAALFGQGCISSGMIKNTYGTGCFALMNTGSTPVRSANNLITTMAWRIDGKPTYALEGSVFIAGAAIQWLRDELKLIESAAETEALARSIPDNGGVYMVPAFTGLGAPHWDMYARGTILGLTRGSGRAHIVRAALESIAFQTHEVIECMVRDSGLRPSVMRVDGGACQNSFIMQYQADLSNLDVLRPVVIETTALGAAMLAGRAVGLWTDQQLASLWRPDRQFVPDMDAQTREHLLANWSRAVAKASDWAT